MKSNLVKVLGLALSLLPVKAVNTGNVDKIVKTVNSVSYDAAMPNSSGNFQPLEQVNVEQLLRYSPVSNELAAVRKHKNHAEKMLNANNKINLRSQYNVTPIGNQYWGISCSKNSHSGVVVHNHNK